MSQKEEIFEDQIEVMNDSEASAKKEKEPIVRHIHQEKMGQENPFQELGSWINDVRRIKPYGIISLLFGFFGIFFWIQILPILAILLGVLDMSIGSKFTRKIAITGILFGVFGLLNAWK